MDTDSTEPRFMADCMLGRLAKWLRVLGYDVAYDRRISDDDLIARAVNEQRIVLTRDIRLARRRAMRRAACAPILIVSDQPGEQLVQMVQQHGLAVRPDRLLTRCLVCNEPTRAAARESVKALVPRYVFLTQESFSRCPACGRIYWRATHVDSIVQRLERRLGKGSVA